MRRRLNSIVFPNTRKARVRTCPERLSKAKKSNGNVLFVVAILAVSALAHAQAKHPFTFDDMMKLKRVGEPEVSPNGKWVIFSVVDVDLAANTKTPHIWIVPTAGGQEREIIADQDGDRPRWAPDGKRFAFLSTKEGGSQVWIAEFDGTAGTITATHMLTDIVTEAGGELWSPDGKNILFTSDVYPECDGGPADETACNAQKLKEHEKSKVKALIFDRLLYRHWNAYKEGKRTHILVVEVPRGNADVTIVTHILELPRDLTPGDYDAPVFSLGGQDNYAFSPDGQEICYASNHDKNPAASTNNDLWLVPVRVGVGDSPAQVLAQTKNITADNPASDSTPLYSPDGRYIAYRAQQRPGYESDRFRLMLYDRKTGEKKNLTEKFDGWVGTFTWYPNSQKIYFTSEMTGLSPFFDVDIDRPLNMPEAWFRLMHGQGSFTGYPPMFGNGETAFDDNLVFTVDGNTLVFTSMSVRHPNEIYLSREWKVCGEGKPVRKGQPTHIPCEQEAVGEALTHLNES